MAGVMGFSETVGVGDGGITVGVGVATTEVGRTIVGVGSDAF